MLPTTPDLPPSSPTQASSDPSSPRPRTRSRASSIRRKPVSYLEGEDLELLAVQDAATKATESWQLGGAQGRRATGASTSASSPIVLPARR